MKSPLIYLSLVACVALNATESLAPITITSATKSEKSVDGVAASVIVITQKEIEDSHAGKLRDILDSIPSVVLQNGAFPAANAKNKSAISIRGLGSSGTLLLINGKRLAGEVKNPYDLDRIPASMIERIEIIKGPSSALYGSDAMGGVINIITKQSAKEFEGSLGIRGEGATKGGGFEGIMDIDVRGKKDRFSYAFNGSVLDASSQTESQRANVFAKHPAQGKVKPSAHPMLPLKNNVKDFYDVDSALTEEARVYNFDTRLGFQASEALELGAEFGFLKEEREGDYVGVFHPSNYGMGGNKIPLFGVPVKSEDKNRRTNWGIDATAKLTPELSLFGRIYQSNYRKRNATSALHWKDLGYPSAEASATSGMNANVRVTSYEAYLQYLALQSHLLTFGGEYREERRDATVFSQSDGMERKEVDYKALYLQDEWEVNERLNALFGVRYDAISNADSKTTFKVGANYALSDSSRLRASFSQGYRSADIRELYISRQTPAGLQLGADVIRGPKMKKYDLKPEFVNAYEVGIGGRNGALSYDVALFYNDISDKIEFVKKPAYFTFENIADAYTMGAELSLGYQWSERFSTSLAWMELKSEDKATNDNLLLTPKRHATLKADYKPLNALTLSATLRHVGAQEYMQETPKGNRRFQASADSFIDVAADYELGKYKLFAGVKNLLDEEVDSAILTNRGRLLYAGARYFF